MMMKKMFALAMLMCLLALPALAETVSYVECKWENGSVVKTEKTAECTTLTPAYVSSLSKNDSMRILNGGWYVVEGNQEISDPIEIRGTVNLILTDNSTMTVDKNIYVDYYEDAVLNIYAQSDELDKMGSLTANKGIMVQSGDSLTIHGGAVTATGYYSAAIGGKYGTAGTVTIYDGVVSAAGGSRGAGIGGGNSSHSDHDGNNGEVIIYGGTVTSTGGSMAAGIGGGSGFKENFTDAGNGGRVEIHGGTVMAQGGSYGAGIGGGDYGKGETVIITGGTVTAQGGKRGAGIGGGEYGNGGDVIIAGGSVKAISGSEHNVAIGRGYDNWDLIETLKNAEGDNVTLYTLTVTGAEPGTEVFGLYDEDYGLQAYGTKDIATDTDNKLYLYLPSGAEESIRYLNTDEGIYTIAWDGKNGTATLAHTHDADGDVYYDEYSDAEHKKCTPCKGCSDTFGYVKEELEAHTWTYAGEGAKLTESCFTNCGIAGGKTELVLTTEKALVYDGADKKEFVQANVNAAFIGEQLPEIVFEGDTIGAGGFTATLTVGGATAKLDVTIEKANPTYTAPTANDLIYDGDVHELIQAGAATGGEMRYSLDGVNFGTDIPTAVDAGEYTVYYKVVGDSNHLDSEAEAIVATIAQSATSMTAQTDKSAYTYGEKISVTVTTAATGSASPLSLRRFAAPAAGQVALYNGSEQLTEAKTVGHGETVTFTLDTVEEGFVLGSYTLSAKYTASGNMDAQAVNFTFSVAFVEDTPENDADVSGEKNEADWHRADPTLTAPEGSQISLDYGPDAVWSDSLTLPTEEGEHSYTYYVKDENGLIAEKVVTVKADKSTPVVEEIDIQSSTNGAEITAPATDEYSGVLDYVLTQNPGKEKLTITNNGNGSFTVEGMEPGKSYDMRLTVRDKVGHTLAVSFTVTAAQLPQTGDNSQLGLWLMLMGMAFAGMAALRKRAYR